MRLVLGVVAAILGIGLTVVTLIPLSPSSAWWVRMWEFPRLHILVLALLTIPLAAWATPKGARGWTILACLIVAGVQTWWVWRYMPWTGEEIAFAEGEGIRVAALNVLQGNRDHDAVRDWIAEADADVLVLMETDAVWAEALAPALEGYALQASHIDDDHYGMIFASRLPGEAEMRFPSRDDEPAAVARLDTPSGPVVVLGLHPHPPVPGTGTEARDRQIALAARLGADLDLPVVAVGDYNDVVWSRDSMRYREIGGFADPRAGRGLMASFDATSWWLRVPIDQALVTEGIDVHGFALGPFVGSDHFPVILDVSPQG